MLFEPVKWSSRRSEKFTAGKSDQLLGCDTKLDFIAKMPTWKSIKTQLPPSTGEKVAVWFFQLEGGIRAGFFMDGAWYDNEGNPALDVVEWIYRTKMGTPVDN